MDADELRAELRKKDLEVELLTKVIKEKEREIIEKEKYYRSEISVKEREARNIEKQFYEEKEMTAKSYHEKKVNEKIVISFRNIK
jgi:hypothetical protein